MFIGENERNKIRRKDMSAMGPRNAQYSAGCFFDDENGLLQIQQMAGMEIDLAESSHDVVASGVRSQWVILVRPQGLLEVSFQILIQYSEVANDGLDLGSA